jgi:thiamine transport system substrate-binding protein
MGERRRRTVIWPALTSMVLLVMIACTGDPAPRHDVAAEPVTLTLLTHDSFDVSKKVLAGFTASTGIDVRVVPAGDAGQLVNRAVLAAGNPEGDVLFGIDNNLLAGALDAGVFSPYTSPRLARVDDDYELDADHRVTPIDHGEVCLNVDRGWFADHHLDEPATLADLTQPAYRGLTVVENPATSTPGLAFLLATVAEFGDPGWQSFWTELRANDVLVVEGWESAYYGEFSGAGGGEGTRPIVVSYATSPVAEVVFADPPVDDAPTAVVASSCFRQIEFAGVLAGTEHPEEAGRLIDFLLSRPFQEDIPLRMFVFPVADDAVVPEVFLDDAVVPRSPLTLAPDEIADHRADWVDQWTDIVVR